MRWLRAGVWVFAIAALTGLGLMFYYVPSALPQAAAGMEHKTFSLGGLLRGTHFWVSQALGPLLVLHLLALLVRRSPDGRNKTKWVLGALWLVLMAAALWFTGTLLPWDELGYWLRTLARERGVHLSLLQIYQVHIALLPIVLGASLFFYRRALKQGKRPSSPLETAI